MPYRGLGAAFAALCCGGLLAAPGAGAAAQVEITAEANNTFVPSRVDILPGDSVIFRNNGGGEHNVHFADGSFRYPSLPSTSNWSGTKVFPSPGAFRFICDKHSFMSGEVVVSSGGPLPDIEKPDIGKASLKARPGRRLRLTFRTNERGTATVKFTRRVGGRRIAVRTVKRKVKPGKVTIDLAHTASGRKLVAGSYRAAITVRDAAGNVSRTAKPTARLK